MIRTYSNDRMIIETVLPETVQKIYDDYEVFKKLLIEQIKVPSDFLQDRRYNLACKEQARLYILFGQTKITLKEK